MSFLASIRPDPIFQTNPSYTAYYSRKLGAQAALCVSIILKCRAQERERASERPHRFAARAASCPTAVSLCCCCTVKGRREHVCLRSFSRAHTLETGEWWKTRERRALHRAPTMAALLAMQMPRWDRRDAGTHGWFGLSLLIYRWMRAKVQRVRAKLLGNSDREMPINQSN